MQSLRLSEKKLMRFCRVFKDITSLASLVFVTLELVACAASQVIISSQPSMVDTTVYNTKTGAHYYLGKTPLKIPYSVIEKEIGEVETNGTFLLYSFKKEAYDEKKLYIPTSRWNTLETLINIELEASKKEEDKNIQAREMIQYLLNAESFLNQNIFDRARVEVDRALKIDPYFSWSYILLGNINYLEKKYSESLANFEKALEYDAKNSQAMKMIPILRAKLEASANE